ncbi:MAG TPA: formate dehydrogenase accessory sulfurtransferase FdhD [Steroidobacteraceae bacterium]|nr:formate dehydrogenase accessory sulfurtransferase FdhD [Steroidobacteraceae bacterium]
MPAEPAIETHKIEAFEVQPQARLMQPVADAPRLTAASCEAMREIEILDEQGVRRALFIPAERALTVMMDERELVTLMTLGASPELLVLGFLRNQRLIKDAAALESISVDWRAGTAIVKSRPAAREPKAALPRIVAGGSGQGSIYTAMMSQLDTIRLPDAGESRISGSALRTVLDVMRQHDTIHRHARSVHSCALFQHDRLLVSVEDVSRHNGLDTVSGWMALHGIDGGDKILFTTGRLTGEMVIKAAQSGVPIVVSRNGVSTMGYDLAKKFGMALFGRAINRRFHCYVGAERFDAG